MKILKKNILWIIAIIILILFIVSYKIINKPTYGNDIESIEEVITSFDIYNGKTIHILGIHDFDDDRVVAFFSNDSPSIVEFERNEKCNYVSPCAETRGIERLSQFIITHVGKNDEVVVVSVRNQFSDIDEFSFISNKNMYKVKFDSDSPNVQWTKLIKSVDGHYSFEWFYSDKES